MSREKSPLVTSAESKVVMDSSMTIRVLLLGPMGSGKSAFGNAILGREAFCSRNSLGDRSFTKQLQHERMTINSESGTPYNLEVTDTPSYEEITSDRTSDRALSQELKSGYDVVVVIIPMQRLTISRASVYRTLRKRFQSLADKHIILVMTFGQRDFQNPGEYLRNVGNKDLSLLVQKVEDRVIVIDTSDDTDKNSKVKLFIDTVLQMVIRNGGKRLQEEERSSCTRCLLWISCCCCVLFMLAYKLLQPLFITRDKV